MRKLRSLSRSKAPQPPSLILHAQQPLKAAANGSFHALGIGIFHALQAPSARTRCRPHRDRKSLRNSKAQPPGSASLIFDLPIAGPEHLLGQNPVRGFHQCRMIGGQSSFFQCDHRDARIPNRRHAWLHPDSVVLFDFEARKFANLARSERIVGTVTKCHQRENRIHHRGINRGEAFGALHVLEHPGFRLAKRAAAKRLPREVFRKVSAPRSSGQENIAPGNERLAPVKRGGFVRKILEEFVDTRAFRQTPIWPQRGKNRHGDDDAARPGRHLVDVQIEPGRQQHQFWQESREQAPSQPHQPVPDKNAHRNLLVRGRPGGAPSRAPASCAALSVLSPPSFSAKYALQVALRSEGPPG